MWHPGWDSRTEKGHSIKTKETLIKYGLQLRIMSQYWLKLWQMYHANVKC